MKKTLIQTRKVDSAEKWIQAYGTLLGLPVYGFGTTVQLAIEDMFRTYQTMKK
jgi:hypothetical protein